MVFEEFKDSKLVIDAVARNFEIIGEAVKNVPKQIKDKYPEVEWKEAAGFRDILIHEYFGIDVEALWDTISNNIDGLKAKITSILQNEHNP
jgi:uncharacterized protein with HEPN domain